MHGKDLKKIQRSPVNGLLLKNEHVANGIRLKGQVYFIVNKGFGEGTEINILKYSRACDAWQSVAEIS